MRRNPRDTSPREAKLHGVRDLVEGEDEILPGWAARHPCRAVCRKFLWRADKSFILQAFIYLFIFLTSCNVSPQLLVCARPQCPPSLPALQNWAPNPLQLRPSPSRRGWDWGWEGGARPLGGLQGRCVGPGRGGAALRGQEQGSPGQLQPWQRGRRRCPSPERGPRTWSSACRP